MIKWQTILTKDYPHEIYLAKSILETQGIACEIADELTAQIAPYSTAIGGIKLKVRGEDFVRASFELQQAGLLGEQDLEPNELATTIDRKTQNIPFIGEMLFVQRIFILAVLFCLCVLAAVAPFVL